MLTRLWQAAAAQLSHGLQFQLRRANFSRQIYRGSFRSPEPEFVALTRHLREGDWVIDVGANVGHYTCRMARSVGASGRVLAFEPIPTSFALLSANVRAAGLLNVTLFNIALSSRAGVQRMTVPTYEHSRLKNYYRSHITADGEYPVVCLSLDSIPLPQSVSLVKIDTEGHELQVLEGMKLLLQRDAPVLIVEASPSDQVASWLTGHGYSVSASAGSSNIVAIPVQS